MDPDSESLHFLSRKQHSVDFVDGVLRRSLGFEVDESVSLAVSALIGGNLAREDVSEQGEGIVDGLVVNDPVQVLDEDVAVSGTTSCRVTLRPHDAHRASVKDFEVHRVKSTFG